MTGPVALASLAVRGGFHDGDWVESKDQNPEGDIRLLQLADVGDGAFRDRSDRWIDRSAFARLRCSWVEPRDILIARMPDPLGRACIVPDNLGPAITVVDIAVLRCDDAFADHRYVAYAVNAADMRHRTKLLQAGATRQRVARKALGRIRLEIPPLDEQRTIANYLDDATARIDNLIAKQHEMIGLLEERRSHVLASTTTLIDAPLVALRRLCRLMGGVGFPHSAQGDQSLEIPFYKVKALGGIRSDGGIGGASDTVSRATAAALGAAIIPAGSLAFAKVGAALLMGRVGTLPGPSCIDNNMAALVPSPDVESAFLRHALLRFPFSEFANPGAVPSLAMKPLMDFKVNVPSISDQRAAVTRVDAETAKIDALIAKTREHIALAKERRSALITAAVTGQFDVRIATREVA